MKKMRRLITMGLSAAVGLAMVLFAVKAHSQQAPANPSPLYVLTFIDVLPAGVGPGTAAIKQYVIDTRKEPGNQRCEAVAQIAGLANHLMVLEVWKDEAAFRKHEGAARTLDFRSKLAPLLGAPFDRRESFLIE